MRTAFIAVIIIVAALIGLILWMAGGIQSPAVEETPPIHLSEIPDTPRTNTSTITVMVWNIAWGYGWGSEGSGTARPKEHFENSLEKMGAAIKAVGADIVLLQEVDFDCSRSHHLNQAKILAEKAGLPYIAPAVSWTANWVPFPYWPPADHFGQMSSGGAILSRYPIVQNRVETMHKPKENAFHYNLFYLFRFFQQAKIKVGGDEVQVFNTHLDAFSLQNRLEHISYLEEYLPQNWSKLSMFGGDFNTVPPEAKQRKDYKDEPETDHASDPSLTRIRNIKGLSDTLTQEQYQQAESNYFTFPAHEPNRKLDYLLHSEGFRVASFRVAKKEGGELSDHLPLVITLVKQP